jgi:hypothetical protein
MFKQGPLFLLQKQDFANRKIKKNTKRLKATAHSIMKVWKVQPIEFVDIFLKLHI